MTAFGSADERPIFLVGFMGSGKSSLARRLARSLGWTAEDTDDLVERREGRNVSRIFAESGEEHFRRLEWEVLQSLEGRLRIVVATGGGLFLRAAARRWMKQRGRTVWLDVPLSVCESRVAGAGTGRPAWVAGDPTALRALYERRRAGYALAELRVRNAAGGAESAAGSVLARL